MKKQKNDPIGMADAIEILDLIEEIGSRWDKMRKQWLREYKITHTQLKVLVILKEKGRLNFKDLSNHLSCAPCNVTGIVDRLEAGGFVKRDRSSKDRRIVNVVLTDKGKKIASELTKAVFPELSMLAGKVLKNLNNGEIKSLYKILPRLLGCFTSE
ncbi:MAG: MarR family transcriptional regulator [Actinomycetota bacterium]|nr:MarR family transcriptional regulator [Actinomycetota bacterium]